MSKFVTGKEWRCENCVFWTPAKTGPGWCERFPEVQRKHPTDRCGEIITFDGKTIKKPGA